jgi:excisionase family DNA binding protein
MATTRRSGSGEELQPTSEQAVAEQNAATKALKRKKRKKKRNREELQPRLMKMKSGARYLAISTGTLRRLIQGGEIPVIKVGDKTCPWLIDRNSLDEWIERTKVRL